LQKKDISHLCWENKTRKENKPSMVLAC
jgi:hypothetical protein